MLLLISFSSVSDKTKHNTMTVQYFKLHYTNMLATPSTDETATSCTVDVVQHLVDMRHTDLKWRTKRMSNILILVCSCVMQSSALRCPEAKDASFRVGAWLSKNASDMERRVTA